MAKRAISKEDHLRNRAYLDRLPPFRSDMSDEDLKAWFSRARSTGLFGKRYRTLEQLKNAIWYLGEGGFSSSQIRDLLQFQSTNPVIKKKGDAHTLNNRAVRQTIPADMRSDVDTLFGTGTADKLESQFSAKWAKERRLMSAEDKVTGRRRDMGHFSEDMLSDPEAQAGQDRRLNRLAGAKGDRPDRFKPKVIREIAPVNKGESVWNAFAQSSGAPRRSGLTTLFPSDVALLADHGFVSEEQMPHLARQLETLEGQGYNRSMMINAIKEYDSTDPRLLAKAGSTIHGPKLPALAGLAIGTALGILGGQSPAEAAVASATSDLEAGPLGNVSNVGGTFIDRNRNLLIPSTKAQAAAGPQGIAIKNGRPILVPYGSVAGTRIQQARKETIRAAQNTVNTVNRINQTLNPVGHLITNEAKYWWNRAVNTITRKET